MSRSLVRDIGASVVVFLVALPLCLAVALATGADPELGIISGIVGGIVVGAFGGSPLQVSGPAAGLIVSVLVVVEGWGLEALGYAVIISGLLQLLAAGFKLGRWFRAVSPALIGGMLAGIGVIIIGNQLHAMVGHTGPRGGLASAIALPATWSEALGTEAGLLSAAVGVATIVVLFAWDLLRPKKLEMIPGPLVAALIVTVLSVALGLDVPRVVLPESLGDALNVPQLSNLGLLTDTGFLGASLALGLIAAAETLLCANATDQLHRGPPTQYDKELFGLGLGNVVAGLFGALPVTGVIVRSSVNIRAGATTKRSTIIHGFLLLGLVALAPSVLSFIPKAVLAGILIYAGLKLLAPKKIKALYEAGDREVWVFVATVTAIFATDLLIGIGVGLAVSLLKLLYTFSHIEVDVERDGDRYDVDVHGAATFVQLPKLAEALEAIPEDKEVHVHIGGLAYVDHACAELLQRQEERRVRAGGRLVTEWDELHRLRAEKPLVEQRASDPGDVGSVPSSVPPEAAR